MSNAWNCWKDAEKGQYTEDDAFPPDGETLAEAERRLFGEPLDNKDALAYEDDQDAFFYLHWYDGAASGQSEGGEAEKGRYYIVCRSYRGNNAIRKVPKDREAIFSTMHDDFKLPFGKFKGQRLADVNVHYLDWMLSLDNLYPATRAAILGHLGIARAEEWEALDGDSEDN